MTKKELRKLIYARRKAATDEQVVTASRQINEKIYATEAYQKAGSVFTYMDYKHEVMTRDFIEQAWKDGKRVAVNGFDYVLDDYAVCLSFGIEIGGK